MAQLSVELQVLADAAYRALNSGDLEAFLALTAEDVEFTSMVAEAEGTTFRGHSGVRAWWESVRGAFEDPRWEELDIRGSGDRGVVKLRLTGTLAGAEVAQIMWLAAKLRGGKLGWWGFFRSEQEALEAVGLQDQAMSQGNVEVVRASLEALGQGGVDAAAEFWDPRIDWRAIEGAPDDVGDIRGVEELRAHLQDWGKNFDDLRLEAEELTGTGTHVVAVQRLSGRAKRSGVRTQQRYAVVYTVRDGKIVKGREYVTREEALETLGLRE